ncbi:MAG: TIGR04283 family arsenosugar biosynthesis glycosyltransferase [Acidiferrobacterales bacterium]|nr:TIGR04283 family arsenosugar biosynthesis glycosyltransferase [Acidiferrobacterales bacterium]
MSHPTEPFQHQTVSIVVPVRNEPPQVLRQINALVNLQCVVEVIVVDASERRLQSALAEILDPSITLIRTETAGRAAQMNLGSSHASGQILWFLHSDSTVPADAATTISNSVTDSCPWGRFDVQFRSSASLMRLVAKMMNLRSALTNICTGDQAIFVDRAVFAQVGSFPQIAIMEDVALSRKLKSTGSMVRIRTPIQTSARRWESCGHLRTIVLMWMMRLLYWAGVSPDRLARLYRQVR